MKSESYLNVIANICRSIFDPVKTKTKKIRICIKKNNLGKNSQNDCSHRKNISLETVSKDLFARSAFLASAPFCITSIVLGSIIKSINSMALALAHLTNEIGSPFEYYGDKEDSKKIYDFDGTIANIFLMNKKPKLYVIEN